MFLEYLASDPHFFVYVVVTMVTSVVLHELAHGWAALAQGDPTPRQLGHLTIDPRVHMGWPSLLLLVTTGMCYGAMPVDPTRFRSRHGNLIVAAAGPLMNLLLAFVALTTLAIWALADGSEQSEAASNLRTFVWTFGYCNVALGVFNLLPIPPLDGSTVLAGLHRGYARWIAGFRNPVVFLALFLLVWSLLSDAENGLCAMAAAAADSYLQSIHALAGR